MMKPAVFVPEDQPLTFATQPPGRTQKWLAFAVVLVFLGVLYILAGELSNVQLGQFDGFVPAYSAAIFVNDLITAVLLFNQFAILRSRALLVTASGYLFSALIIIPWALTFPGPSGLLGAGLQSSNWLRILRLAAFPTFLIGYALLKDADPTRGVWRGSAGAAIFSGVAVTSAVVCAATILVTAGYAYLPSIMRDSVYFPTLWLYVANCLILYNAFLLILLWVRRRSILDLWLMVVVCAWAIEIYLVSYSSQGRFSAGWYAGRVFGLLSSILVLLALLYEIMALYAQLLHAVLEQHRERAARLVTGDAVAATIAHEVKQPLSAMITNANAGLRWLDRSTPDLDEVKDTLKRIAADGHRTGVVIDGIRAMFKSDTRNRTSLDINALINEVLLLLRSDLRKHQIIVHCDLNRLLPKVTGDRIQMQQVLLNLVTNAIESMANEGRSRVLSIESDVEDGSVRVSVADTGEGIGSQDADRIFDPLITTKPGGMGMGLSICRSIIEAHGGRLWVAANTPQGAAFQFHLSADTARSTGVEDGSGADEQQERTRF